MLNQYTYRIHISNIERFTELLRYSMYTEEAFNAVFGWQKLFKTNEDYILRANITLSAEIAFNCGIPNTSLAKCTARFFTEVITQFTSG